MSYPEMLPVSSSNVLSVGYDENSQEVYVRFLNNTLYVYRGVPQHEYDNLLQAPSVGNYLHLNYKNAYPYEKLE